jgi:hypothetical protein
MQVKKLKKLLSSDISCIKKNATSINSVHIMLLQENELYKTILPKIPYFEQYRLGMV